MKRSSTLTAAAIAAALFGLTGCSGSTPAPAAEAPAADAPAEPETEAPAEAPAAPAMPGLNTPVAVGTLEFTATAFTAIGKTIGTSSLTQDAQGTYLQVDLSVKNTGNKSATFLVNYVKLIDVNGNEYDSDTMAGIYLDSDTTWITGINPGNAAAGAVVFDVPEGTEAASLLVSDGLFSKGTEIALK